MKVDPNVTPQSAPIARRHHFVPEFLLSPWRSVEDSQNLLTSYEWQPKVAALRRRRLSTSRVCNRIDLYSLVGKRLRPDVMETHFFQQIDSDGAGARDILLAGDTKALDARARVKFARFLLSLEPRRPDFITKLRERGYEYFGEKLDNDPEILAAMAAENVAMAPSAFAERESGLTPEDRAIVNIPNIILKRERVMQVVSWNWSVLRLPPQMSFIIGDRPLCRTTASDQPNVIWSLPLTPAHIFIASPDAECGRRASLHSPQKLERVFNTAMASQCEKSVFVTQDRHAAWLGKYLRKRSITRDGGT